MFIHIRLVGCDPLVCFKSFRFKRFHSYACSPVGYVARYDHTHAYSEHEPSLVMAPTSHPHPAHPLTTPPRLPARAIAYTGGGISSSINLRS
eukprot:3296613-Prymnesium_polylepis.1